AEAPLKQRPGPPVGAVDVLDLALFDDFLQHRWSSLACRRQHQMYMVRHQDIGMNANRRAALILCAFPSIQKPKSTSVYFRVAGGHEGNLVLW
ncbi:MAG: hypothetical protein P8Z41_16865, partial [Anaerolineales bacterium]